MKGIYNVLKGYGYKIGQVDVFTVQVDSVTGLLELLAHIPENKQDIGKQLVIFEYYNTEDNYYKLDSMAIQATQCAILNGSK